MESLAGRIRGPMEPLAEGVKLNNFGTKWVHLRKGVIVVKKFRTWLFFSCN
jgi:hypothetical protein